MSPPLNRILYIEDDPDIQSIAVTALEGLGGWAVKACDSGEQALCEAPGFAPDLILLDVMMQGLDGPATLRALRRDPGLAGVPAVFLTARVQPHETTQYLALGAIDVIPKPFDPMKLAGILRTIWERHHAP